MTRSQAVPDYSYPFISSLRLERFKSVASAEVELCPLTFLVGENSSGKSTVLQGIRLLQQGARSQSTKGIFPMNGDIIGMGNSYDIRTNQLEDYDTHVSVGISLHIPRFSQLEYPTVDQHTSTIECDNRPVSIPEVFNLLWDVQIGEAPPASDPNIILGVRLCIDVPDDSRLSSTVILKRSRPDSGSELVWIRSYLSPIMIAETIPGLAGEVRSNEEHKVITTVSLAGLRGVFPYYLAVKRSTDEISKSFNREAISSLDALDKQQILDLLTEYLTDDHTSEIRTKPGDDNTNAGLGTDSEESVNVNVLWEDDQWSIIRFFSSFTRSWFSENDILYLGPLREEPWIVERPAPSPDSLNIGRRGEFTAQVVFNSARRIIRVPMPDGKANSDVELIRAIRCWTAHLGLAEAVEAEAGFRWEGSWMPLNEAMDLKMRPEDLVDIGLVTKVGLPGIESTLPLASVGVGVSQLLPVLVLCLLAEPGSVILLEQPELHLHPALQQRLADFFIAIAGSGRQLIVETHSEYMVSRLRRRIVEDPDDKLLAMTKVIFAERDRQTGLSRFRDVELTPYGDIDEWPQGFFDQAGEEERAIILGGLRKRRKHAENAERSE